MTKEQQQEIDAAIKATVLKDLPFMTVKEHHLLSVGVLSACYKYVPHDIQIAIMESLQALKSMGANIDFDHISDDTISNS